MRTATLDRARRSRHRFRPMLSEGLAGAGGLETRSMASGFTEAQPMFGGVGTHAYTQYQALAGGTPTTYTVDNTHYVPTSASGSLSLTSGDSAGPPSGVVPYGPSVIDSASGSVYGGYDVVDGQDIGFTASWENYASVATNLSSNPSDPHTTVGNDYASAGTVGSGAYTMSGPPSSPYNYNALQVIFAVSYTAPTADSRVGLNDSLTLTSSGLNVTIGIGAPNNGVSGLSVYSPITGYSYTDSTFGSTGSNSKQVVVTIPLTTSSYSYSYQSSAAVSVFAGSTVGVGTQIVTHTDMLYALAVSYAHV